MTLRDRSFWVPGRKEFEETEIEFQQIGDDSISILLKAQHLHSFLQSLLGQSAAAQSDTELESRHVVAMWTLTALAGQLRPRP